jgi:hypothetical protein
MWRPVEAWLREQGHAARAVDLGSEPRTPDLVLETLAAAAVVAGEPIVVVPHSNAGLFAPQLATLVHVRTTVYVDAALPDLGTGEIDTALAPPEFLGFLRTLADADGLLPPWTEWWDNVADLFPDHASYAAVEREQQRLPLSYFTSRIPVPADWTQRPAAYLAFGETYAVERSRAIEAGWPTMTMDAGHLHPLHDPPAVGAAVLELSRAAAP